MADIHAEASAVIAAPAEKIYGILVDYQGGHAAILPKPYFKSMIVEQGGIGAGTVITLHMVVMGNNLTFRQTVSEPEPGRLLAESDEAGNITRFRLEPLNGGSHTRVTIMTDSPASPGMRGMIEWMMSPRVLRRIYNEELQLLSEYVAQH